MTRPSFIRVFSSDKRTSGTHSFPLFRNFKPFNLKIGDKIKFSWTLPVIDNVVSPNNKFKVDLLAGNNYTQYTIPEGRYSKITTLCIGIKTACSSLTATYEPITDKIIISAAANFTLNVEANDLMNFLGFSVGVKTGEKSYTCEGHPDIFPDNIFIQSNLADYIEDGDYSINREGIQYPDRVCDTIKLYSSNNRTLVYDNNLEYTINKDMNNLNEIWFRLLDINSNLININNQMSCTLSVIGKKED